VIRKCAACPRLVGTLSEVRASPGIVHRHDGQGMCSRCYHRERRERIGRTKLSRDTVLEEVAFAIEGGERSLDRLAGWVGISRDALTLALRRAERAGDERARQIRSQLPVRRVA
jgi:hypothetical protein